MCTSHADSLYSNFQCSNYCRHFVRFSGLTNVEYFLDRLNHRMIYSCRSDNVSKAMLFLIVYYSCDVSLGICMGWNATQDCRKQLKGGRRNSDSNRQPLICLGEIILSLIYHTSVDNASISSSTSCIMQAIIPG
jgi:hypothetical protein